MMAVEGEESNLPCGTLSLFDRWLLVSPVLPIRGVGHGIPDTACAVLIYA